MSHEACIAVDTGSRSIRPNLICKAISARGMIKPHPSVAAWPTLLQLADRALLGATTEKKKEGS